MLWPHRSPFPPQAAEQAEKMKEQHRREERENLAEVRHTLTSDMMTECAEAAQRAEGGGRPPLVLSDRWRGMRPEQLSAIHREQEAQRLERQVRESPLNHRATPIYCSCTYLHFLLPTYLTLKQILK